MECEIHGNSSCREYCISCQVCICGECIEYLNHHHKNHIIVPLSSSSLPLGRETEQVPAQGSKGNNFNPGLQGDDICIYDDAVSLASSTMATRKNGQYRPLLESDHYENKGANEGWVALNGDERVLFQASDPSGDVYEELPDERGVGGMQDYRAVNVPFSDRTSSCKPMEPVYNEVGSLTFRPSPVVDEEAGFKARKSRKLKCVVAVVAVVLLIVLVLGIGAAFYFKPDATTKNNTGFQITTITPGMPTTTLAPSSTGKVSPPKEVTIIPPVPTVVSSTTQKAIGTTQTAIGTTQKVTSTTQKVTSTTQKMITRQPTLAPSTDSESSAVTSLLMSTSPLPPGACLLPDLHETGHYTNGKLNGERVPLEAGQHVVTGTEIHYSCNDKMTFRTINCIDGQFQEEEEEEEEFSPRDIICAISG